MNDTKIASKAKAQLSNFMGKVFTHFSKPTKRFIEECIYGIQASGDTNYCIINFKKTTSHTDRLQQIPNNIPHSLFRIFRIKFSFPNPSQDSFPKRH